jgi:hypothetical protein
MCAGARGWRFGHRTSIAIHAAAITAELEKITRRQALATVM